MKNISVSNDIIPVGEFKIGIAKWLKSVQNTNHPLIITQNGKPAGVLLSPSEYDDLVDKKLFVDSIRRGFDDVEKGSLYTTEELRVELKKAQDAYNKMKKTKKVFQETDKGKNLIRCDNAEEMFEKLDI